MVFFSRLGARQSRSYYYPLLAIVMALWWVTEALHWCNQFVTHYLPIWCLDGKVFHIHIKCNFFIHRWFFYVSAWKMDLLKRLALRILSHLVVPFKIILCGFMLASFLSMWMSNTATAMMMLPIVPLFGRNAWRKS
jgi:sodium-dependent dicarboxylate transporter 2/3/5